MTFTRNIIAINIALTTVISIVSFLSLNCQDKINTRIIHTLKALNELENISTSVKEAESSIRGYVIARDPKMLKEYNQAVKHTYSSFSNTRAYIEGHDKVFEKLKYQLDKRVKLLDIGVKARPTKPEFASQMVSIGNLATQDVLQSITEMENEQQRSLSSQVASVSFYSNLTKGLFVCIFISAVIMVRTYRSRLKASFFTTDRQAAILDALPANVAIINAQGVITSVNERWTASGKNNNYPGGGLKTGGSYLEIIEKSDNSDSKMLANGIRKVIEGTSKSFFLDYQFLNQGEVRWYRAIITPLQKRHLPEFVILQLDITEIKETERQLKQINQRFSLVTKATSDAIWDWDLLTGQRYLSEMFSTHYGFDLKDGDAAFDFWMSRIHSADRPRVVSSLEHAINNSHEILWSDNYLFLKADGSFAEVKADGYILRDDQGRAIRMVGALQDRTHYNRQRQQIKEHQQRLRNIAIMNSHELRKPLANILALIEVIEASEIPEVPELVDMLKHSAAELDQKVKGIADLANFS